jgi:hypothetical protein
MSFDAERSHFEFRVTFSCRDGRASNRLAAPDWLFARDEVATQAERRRPEAHPTQLYFRDREHRGGPID